MKIFIDYDTTLVNLIDPWVNWINKKYDVNIETTDINRWYFLSDVFGEDANDFWKSEEYNHYIDKDIFMPYSGARDFFDYIVNEFGRDNVFIVSSTRDHHTKEKIEHAKYYFGINESNFIPTGSEKHSLTKNGILIDDYPLHIFEHIHHNDNFGIVFNLENRFGWCRECNYELDPTLGSYMNVKNNKKFSIATSYNDVVRQLNKIKEGVKNGGL